MKEGSDADCVISIAAFFFYWIIYSSWMFLWSSVLDFQQVCWFNDFSKSSCQAWPMMAPEEAFSAAVQELWSQEFVFFSFWNLRVSKTMRKTECEGMVERNPHQVARKHISPFGGKCGLRANLALSSFEPRPMCKMAVLVIFSFTDYRFLALAGIFLSGFFNKNVT